MDTQKSHLNRMNLGSIDAESDCSDYVPNRNMRWWWIGGFVLVLTAAIATRVWIHFRGPIPPAMDPAYYPMQAWWLFDQGRLLYQDAPLLFVIDGLLAQVLIAIGMQSDSAYLVASQVVDCMTEPWVALFVFLFGFVWCGGARRGIPVVMAGAILAVLSAPVIRMVSDFEKNSLGLVWAAMTWWALWRAIGAMDMKLGRAIMTRWFTVASVALALAALTHGGSFGCAAFGAVTIMGIWFVIGGATKRALITGALAIVIVGAMSFVLLYAVSPSRAHDVLTAPQNIFGGAHELYGRGRPGGPRPDGMNVHDDRGPRRNRHGAMDQREKDRPEMGNRADTIGPRGGPPGRGGPGGRESHGTFIGLGVGLCGIILVAFRWRKETIANRATIVGLSALCIFLVFPLLNPEYAQRLNLMASVPVGIVFTFLLARLAITTPPRVAGALWQPPKKRWRTAIAWLISGIVSYGAIHSIRGTSTPGPVINQVELQELFDMRSEIAAPQTTLVVAAHGLQWWAGHALHTPVRMENIPDDAFTKYSRVLILMKNKHSGRGKPNEYPPKLDNARRVYEGTYFSLFEVTP